MTRQKAISEACLSERKVLFLDFDGVIHRLSAYVTPQGLVSANSSIRLFEFAPILTTLLEPYPTVEIVLSTSWVRGFGFQYARDALPVHLRNRVSDATYDPESREAWAWPEIGRGIQVMRYVEMHGLTRWLAIDDENDGFEEDTPHFIQCDPKLGLGDEATRRRIESGLFEQFWLEVG